MRSWKQEINPLELVIFIHYMFLKVSHKNMQNYSRFVLNFQSILNWLINLPTIPYSLPFINYPNVIS